MTCTPSLSYREARYCEQGADVRHGGFYRAAQPLDTSALTSAERLNCRRGNVIGLFESSMISGALRTRATRSGPIERTGIIKLVSEVFGGILLAPEQTGRSVATMQLPTRDEETEKRVLGLLLADQTLVNLDNIRAAIDSQSLASLLTAASFTGRVLGESKVLTLPNRLVLVGTGNHVRASGEIAKRSVPIQLHPSTDAPEDRDDFRHADLPNYVAAVRGKVLGCLVGMVLNWLDAGQPAAEGVVPLGGFEAWSRAIGGILHLHDFRGWRTNEPGWRRAADPEGDDLRALVEAWWAMHGETPVSAGTVADLAKRGGLFGEVFAGKSEDGGLRSFARRVLRTYEGRPVAGKTIHRGKWGNNSTYHLKPR